MGFLKLFGGKRTAGQSKTVALHVVEPEVAKEVVQGEKVSPEEKNTGSTPFPKDTPMVISYATGWPIDVVYGHLRKNYEQKGFEDALVKSDLTFKDINMNIIKHKILMVFREVNLSYDVKKQDLQTRIDNCNAAGLLTTVSELEKTMMLINTHKAELRRLEEDFRNNTNEASIPLQSYECGFLRGIASISLGHSPAGHAATTSPFRHDAADERSLALA